MPVILVALFGAAAASALLNVDLDRLGLTGGGLLIGGAVLLGAAARSRMSLPRRELLLGVAGLFLLGVAGGFDAVESSISWRIWAWTGSGDFLESTAAGPVTVNLPTPVGSTVWDLVALPGEGRHPIAAFGPVPMLIALAFPLLGLAAVGVRRRNPGALVLGAAVAVYSAAVAGPELVDRVQAAPAALPEPLRMTVVTGITSPMTTWMLTLAAAALMLLGAAWPIIRARLAAGEHPFPLLQRAFGALVGMTRFAQAAAQQANARVPSS